MRVLALLGMVAACGGGSGGGLGTRAITAEAAEPLCSASCQRDVTCGFEFDVAECTTRCVAEFAGWARADAIQIRLECRAALTCDLFDDGRCSLGIRPLAVHEEWETKCRPTLGTCPELDPDDREEVCEATPDGAGAGFISLIAAELMPEVNACLDEATCQAQLVCIESTFEAHNINL